MDKLLVIAGAVVVLGAAVTVLARAGLRVAGVVRRVQEFLDDWNGEPARPGVLRRLGVPERLSAIEGRLQAVEKEMHPNAGSTLRDAVDRVETAVSGGDAP